MESGQIQLTNLADNVDSVFVLPGSHFIAGLLSGFAGKVIEYPFDTIKVRMQTINNFHPHTIYSVSRPFDQTSSSSIGECNKSVANTKSIKFMNVSRSIYNTRGLKGFYDGLPAPLLGAAIDAGILFSTFTLARDVIHTANLFSRDAKQNEKSEPGLGTIMLAGGFGGGCISFFLTPIELIKCRMQVDTERSTPRYKSSFDCLKKSLYEESSGKLSNYKLPNIQNMFKGLSSTMLRECPGNAAWFGTYYAMIDFLTRCTEPHSISDRDSVDLDHSSTSTDFTTPINTVSPPPWIVMLSGSMAGVSFWSAFYPADVVKSRIQTITAHPALLTNSYNSKPPKITFASIFTHIYRVEGIKGLYRGYLLTVCRSAPSNATMFLVYEYILSKITPCK